MPAPVLANRSASPATIADSSARARRALVVLAGRKAAINDMDKVTQRGAAMVEPSTVASHAPPREGAALGDGVRVFQTSNAPSRGQTLAAAPKAVGHPGSARVRQPAPCQGADQWEEF